MPTDLPGPHVLKVTAGSIGFSLLYVYEDGTVLRLGVAGKRELPGVTRLSPSGLDRLLRTVRRSNLLAGDDIEPHPDAAGVSVYRIELRTMAGLRDRTVVAPWRARDRAEAQEFIALVDRLLALWAWLPRDAWLDRDPQPWIPASYVVHLDFNDGPPRPLPSLEEPWPFDADPRDFGVVISVTEHSEVRCGVVTSEEFRALIVAYGSDPTLFDLDLELLSGEQIVYLWGTGLFPDEADPCKAG